MPSTFNSKYAYGFNSPTNFTDPKGELPFLVVAIIIGSIMGGIDAASSGGNLLQGMGYGAISGLAIGAGMLASAALVGGGLGMGSFLLEISVSGFLSGLFNAAALGMVKGNTNSFTKDFRAGFIGGALGTAFKGPGVPEGVEQGSNVGDVGEEELDDEMTKEAIRKLKLKMKMQMGF